MNVKKCDACGFAFEPDLHKDCDSTSYRIKVQKKVWIFRIWVWKEIDLCKRCFHGLSKLFEKNTYAEMRRLEHQGR